MAEPDAKECERERQALLADLRDQATEFLHRKHRGDDFWLCKANSRLFAEAARLVEATLSGADTADFADRIVEAIFDKVDWGWGENWPDSIHQEAVRNVRERLFKRYEAAYDRLVLRRNSQSRELLAQQARLRARRVFLSYSSADGPVVDEFDKVLREAGIATWLDKREISIGQEIHARIADGLADARYVCIFLSMSSVSSGWVEVELRQALEKNIQHRLRFLPVLLEPCSMPSFLSGIRYETLFELERPQRIPEIVQGILATIRADEG